MPSTPLVSDLEYLGTLKGPTRSAALGDVQLGRGLAVKETGAGFKLYLGANNPSQIIECDVPASLSGPLVNPHSIGTLGCSWFPHGVFYDSPSDTFYLTCHSDYDGDPATAKTISRGHLVNGKLTSEGQWAFANRSDKLTDGGICAIPAWFASAHNLGRLGVGFGMYRSVVATGRASMGLALATFSPPASLSASAITCQPLLGYPYLAGGTAARMHRSTNYTNDFHDGYPITPSSTGYTTWADYGIQCATWVDTDTLSGFVGIVMRGTGRCWYDTNTVAAEGWRYDFVAYSASDLAALAAGAAQDSVQPAVDTPFVVSGMTLPTNGLHRDSPGYIVSGVAFAPIAKLLFVSVQGVFGTDGGTLRHGIYVLKVNERPQSSSYTFTATRVTTGTVTEQATVTASGLTRAAALAVAQQQTLTWVEVSSTGTTGPITWT